MANTHKYLPCYRFAVNESCNCSSDHLKAYVWSLHAGIGKETLFSLEQSKLSSWKVICYSHFYSYSVTTNDRVSKFNFSHQNSYQPFRFAIKISRAQRVAETNGLRVLKVLVLTVDQTTNWTPYILRAPLYNREKWTLQPRYCESTQLFIHYFH